MSLENAIQENTKALQSLAEIIKQALADGVGNLALWSVFAPVNIELVLAYGSALPE